jgi:GNAT superfamily N-acetyltransferase
MNSIAFQVALPGDYARIACLHAESWRNSYRGILVDDYLDNEIAGERQQLWKARLSAGGLDRRYVLLAEIQTELIGFVCVLLDEEPGWGACLDNLHVRPGFYGRGIGRQLFAHATRWVMTTEPDWPIHLWVFEANVPARRFYEAFKGEIVERKIKPMPGQSGVFSIRYVWRDLRMLLEILRTGFKTSDHG